MLLVLRLNHAQELHRRGPSVRTTRATAYARPPTALRPPSQATTPPGARPCVRHQRTCQRCVADAHARLATEAAAHKHRPKYWPASRVPNTEFCFPLQPALVLVGQNQGTQAIGAAGTHGAGTKRARLGALSARNKARVAPRAGYSHWQALTRKAGLPEGAANARGAFVRHHHGRHKETRLPGVRGGRKQHPTCLRLPLQFSAAPAQQAREWCGVLRPAPDPSMRHASQSASWVARTGGVSLDS